MVPLSEKGLLAVVPARGGSKGLPGKNLRPLAGVSLLEHAIRFARACTSVTRVVVSTDSDEIAAAARAAGADVPFMRPPELAADDTPMWPVLAHALSQLDPDAELFEYLLLVDPTSPVRAPADVEAALDLLRDDPAADGVVSVAEPPFNPVWQCVVERDGVMSHLVPDGAQFARRQDAPPVYYIDGSIYLWRTRFVRAGGASWFEGRNRILAVESFGSIDSAEELRRLDALVQAGIARLPWLNSR